MIYFTVGFTLYPIEHFTVVRLVQKKFFLPTKLHEKYAEPPQ